MTPDLPPGETRLGRPAAYTEGSNGPAKLTALGWTADHGERRAPVVIWHPGFLSEPETLNPTGPLNGGPFATLQHSVAAATVHRRHHKGAITLFVATRDGFVGHTYNKSRLGRVDLNELDVYDLPLGDPDTPSTYVLDARGRLGQIERTKDGYTWAPRDDLPTEAIRPGRVVPAVAPQPQYKAGGSRHSWSPTATSESVYIHPEAMKGVTLLGDDLMRVGAGTTIRETNRFLWKNGRSIPVLGGFDGQTWGGVLPTGTHGSVLAHGPMAELIRSVDLVKADGSKVRLERRDGPTDAETFRAAHPDMTLLQGDDTFDAAMINMGTMGIVHAYVIDVSDTFHMREVRTNTTLADIKAKLAGGGLAKLTARACAPTTLAEEAPAISDGTDGGFAGHPIGAYHMEALFNPHGDDNSDVVITSRHPTTVAETDAERFGFTPPGRDLFRALDLGAEFTRPAVPTWIAEHLGNAARWTTDTIGKLIPSATPWLVDRALDTLPDHAYVDRSFNVFNIGDGANHIPAISGTIFVPIEGDKYLEAIDVLRATAAKFAAKDQYHSGPISIRFVQASRAMLFADKDVASFELIFTAGNEHAQEMIEGYDTALRDRFGDRDVTVHWGQMMKTPTRAQAEQMYPRFKEFCAIRDRFDPGGVFLNDWQAEFMGVGPR